WLSRRGSLRRLAETVVAARPSVLARARPRRLFVADDPAHLLVARPLEPLPGERQRPGQQLVEDHPQQTRKRTRKGDGPEKGTRKGDATRFRRNIVPKRVTSPFPPRACQ